MNGGRFAFMPCRAMVLMLAMAIGPAWAQDRPVDLLFARPHLSGLASGVALTYRLERVPSDTTALGEPFSDDIKLTVRSVGESGTRDVALRIFTGERAREVAFGELTGNPLLVVFLDRAVGNMVRLVGGTAPYFKGRLRAALRDKATSEAAKAEFEGKTLAATRIIVRPFAEDDNVARMLGYEASQFEFLVAEAVPGMLLEMRSRFESTLPNAPKLEERIFLKSRTQP